MEEIDMFFGRATRQVGAQRDSDAVLIRAAQIEDILSHQPLKPSVAITREIGACNMAKMQGPICIGKRRGDENLHCLSFLSCSSHALSSIMSISSSSVAWWPLKMTLRA